jgi:hypothetical protein
MAAPKGSHNNPRGRPPGDAALRTVQFSVRVAPDVALWIEQSAARRGVREAKVINDGLRKAMNQDTNR